MFSPSFFFVEEQIDSFFHRAFCSSSLYGGKSVTFEQMTPIDWTMNQLKRPLAMDRPNNCDLKQHAVAVDAGCSSHSIILYKMENHSNMISVFGNLRREFFIFLLPLRLLLVSTVPLDALSVTDALRCHRQPRWFLLAFVVVLSHTSARLYNFHWCGRSAATDRCNIVHKILFEHDILYELTALAGWLSVA